MPRLDRARILLPTLWISLAACGGDTIVEPAIPANRPPIVLELGPDYGSTNVAGFRLPEPWAVFGDPDGKEDIVAVVAEVDSVRFLSATLRPPVGEGCQMAPDYSASSPVDLLALLPAAAPGIRFVIGQGSAQYGAYVMERVLDAGGSFSQGPLRTEAFLALAPELGADPAGGCGNGFSLMRFGIYPPALDPAGTGLVTLLEVVFEGVSMTAVDNAGHRVEASFGDIHALFGTEEELGASSP